MSTTTATMKQIVRVSSNGNGKAKGPMEPIRELPTLTAEIRELQRQRCAFQKSRIMIDNRLVANVATTDGYHAGMEQEERLERFADARKVINGVRGERGGETDGCIALAPLIRAVSMSFDEFLAIEKNIEKNMEKLAKQLPIAPWMQLTDQRGFGWLSLAIIVGEAGNLSDYDNPGKLWKRMGCAPIESKGHMRMGSTWRQRKKSNGGLSAAEWEKEGYCPRRRSVMFVISESLMKGNGARTANPDTERLALPAGPYTLRYNAKKGEAIDRNDPEWTPECKTCNGSGETKAGSPCKKCSGRGYMVMRPHLHGMLLAGKLLLKNLWIEWVRVVDGIDPEPWRVR